MTLACPPSRTKPRVTRGGMFPDGAVLQPFSPFSKLATSLVAGAAGGGAGTGAGCGGGAETGAGGGGGGGGGGASAGGDSIGPVRPTGRAAEIPTRWAGPPCFAIATGSPVSTAAPRGATAAFA